MTNTASAEYAARSLSAATAKVLRAIAEVVIVELTAEHSHEFVSIVGRLDDAGLVTWEGVLVGITVKGHLALDAMDAGLVIWGGSHAGITVEGHLALDAIDAYIETNWHYVEK